MTTTTIQFNNGNPFSVGPSGVASASHILPATVTTLELDLLDPLGDWVNPANAGGNFQYGVQYSPDSGTTWLVALDNAGGQPIGSVNPKNGDLPKLVVSSPTALSHLYGIPCRAFAMSSTTIRIAAQAIVTT